MDIFFSTRVPQTVYEISVYASSKRNFFWKRECIHEYLQYFLYRVSNEVFFFFRQVYVIPIRDYEIAFTRETHLGIFYYREYYSFKLFKCSNVYHRKFYDSFIRVRPMKSQFRQKVKGKRSNLSWSNTDTSCYEHVCTTPIYRIISIHQI